MKITEIKQDYLKPNTIRVLNWQLNFDEIDIEFNSELPNIISNSSLKNQFLKVLELSSKHSIDLIVLPELSVPSDLIYLFQEYSLKTGTTIVAGSHYTRIKNQYYSRTPIIINGDISFTEKLNPAPSEKSLTINKGLTPGEQIFHFKDTPVGNFVVAICADYLEPNTRNNILNLELDFVVIIAFQSDSSEYVNRINIDCLDSDEGIYFIYCNGYMKKYCDGNSSLFGLIDNLYHNQLLHEKYSDLVPQTKLCNLGQMSSYFIVDIDLKNKKPKLPRNVNTSPNIKVVKFGLNQSFKNDYFIEKIFHTDEKYQEINKLYVKPKEYKSIIRKLEENKIVFIVGDPGIGKTYTAVKILKEYFGKNYDPVWYVGLEKDDRAFQAKILDEFQPKDNQIVYFEDPFGRTKFENRDILYKVFSPLIDNIKYINARIIITSRKEVFNQFLKENPNDKEILDFKEEMNVINPSYEVKELKQILEKLAKSRCSWFSDINCKKIVFDAIESGKINTPLTIKDLVFSTSNLSNPDELFSITQKRTEEIIKIFEQEILQTDIPTKTTLALVYLFGYRRQSFLIKIFNKVISELNFLLNLKIFTSFKQILREQKGYRIESIGPQSKGLRISHPSYEEAIVDLLEYNLEFTLIAEKIINITVFEDFSICVNSIARYIEKYPNLSIKLFHIILKKLTKTDTQKNIYIGKRLLLGFNSTGNNEYLKILNKLITIDDAILSLNEENDLSIISSYLQFIYNYTNIDSNHPSDSIVELINWDGLKNKILDSKKYTQIIDILEWTKTIDEKVFLDYLDGIGKIIHSNMIQFDFTERNRIKELFNNSKYRKSIFKRIKEQPLVNQIRKIGILSYSKLEENCFISIDSGASKAIVNKMSLLAAGITEVVGEFEALSYIEIRDENNNPIGKGIVNYNSDEINLMKGCHSSLILEVCGRFNGNAIVKNNRLRIYSG